MLSVDEFKLSTPSLLLLTLILIYARVLVHIGHIWPYSDTCISVVDETRKSKIANSSQTIRPMDVILKASTVLEDNYLVMTSYGHAHFRFGRQRPSKFIFETRFSPKRLGGVWRLVTAEAPYKSGRITGVRVLPFGDRAPEAKKNVSTP